MLNDRFARYIKERELAREGERILLAVSGGVDSMVMLYMFRDMGYDIGVAHCNFCLRGEEADEDERSVEEVCRKLGVEHFNIRFDTLAEMENTGESIQMAARRLRYKWFDALCEEHGYDKIAIAHHSDDSIETFFINLIRGTGLRGLTGINVVNGRLIRPLLFASRREISEYAVQNGIAFREDSSNRSTKYLRNKIRLGVIPKIREVSPVFGKTMTYNVERLSAALSFIDRQMELIAASVMTRREGEEVYDINLIDPSLPRSYVIFELLRPYGFNIEVTHDLYNGFLAGTSGTSYSSATHIAYLDRGNVIVRRITDTESYNVLIGEGVKREFCLGGTLAFDKIEIEDLESRIQPDNIALLDAGLVKFPLTVRIWREGDSFIPLGMQGHKKVSDYLIDDKVAVPDKQRQLVVLSGEEVVWLVGRRIDDRYKITDSTRNVLRITKEQNDDSEEREI